MRSPMLHQSTKAHPTGGPAGQGRTRPVVTSGHIIPQFEEDQCSATALEDILRGRFTFNGESHTLGTTIDWLSNPCRDIEWQIMLHKFYFAPGLAQRFGLSGDSRYLECFKRLVVSWIEQSPPGFIATDVTARRVQNWIYACDLFSSHDPDCLDGEFADLLRDSIATQLNYVCDNMAPARNHRTLELYAVFLGSIAFHDLDVDETWRRIGVAEMSANIHSDLLADGVHCELSTDYHHIVLRSYLLFVRLAQLNDIPLPDDLLERVCKALDFAMHIHRPDGLIPALSDADSRSYTCLLAWGAGLFGRKDYEYVASAGTRGEPPVLAQQSFADSGYVVLRSPWSAGRYQDARYLVFDCGPIGAGNHGHLDALSIEVAAYGEPLVVDPGRFTYDETGNVNWRARYRSTSAHNTVTVDGFDQGIYAERGEKRKILKPHPASVLERFEPGDDLAYVHGFVQSPNYEAVHHRHIWFVGGRYWLLADRLVSSAVHEYALRFQLPPAAYGRTRLRHYGYGTEFQTARLTTLIVQESPDAGLEDSYVSALYGIQHPAPRICAQQTAASSTFITLLFPTEGIRPEWQLTRHGDGRSLEVAVDDHTDTWRWDRRMRRVSFDGAARRDNWQLAELGNDG